MASGGRVNRGVQGSNVKKFENDLAGKAQKAVNRHETDDQMQKKEIKNAMAAPAPLSYDEKPIRVDAVEFYAASNAIGHHTDAYELVNLPSPSLVLRRGDSFYMGIRFKQRGYDHNKDWLKLVFTNGPKPNIARGTQVEILLSNDKTLKPENTLWQAAVHQVNDSVLTMHVKIGCIACVGLWKLSIADGLKSKLKKKNFDCKEDIYILFNPWCQDDPVYMEDENLLEEYVLNDVGKIYMGVHNSPYGRNWVYGQFDEVILPACLILLDRAKTDYDARGDPISIVRAISAVVNSRDDDGLVVDNWSGDYSGGTSPMDWTGSLKIFEDFVSKGCNPVKFGQCWIFAGCVTTFCRALGIPCRNVTNFVSAHDCHRNLTVDRFYDSKGELKTDLEDQDAIWNFHVWNEVWMSRSDLPKGYGGWQAIDATPQEQSEGSYRLGPASVVATRKGEIGFQYDTLFVVSEVNADIIHWQDDEEADIGIRQMKCNKYFIGKKILTKSPFKTSDIGIEDAEDITHLYKNPEGSQEERLQVLNAARNAHLWYLYNAPTAGSEDVEFDLLEIDKIKLGDGFNVAVTVQNKGNQKRSIFAVLAAHSIYYTGIINSLIKKEKRELILNPEQRETLTLKIIAQDYWYKLVDYAMLKISATASVQETRQSWAEEDDLMVEKPTLQLKTLNVPVVNQPLRISWSFKNPLDVPLEKCRFSFEGPGLSRPKIVPFRDIVPGEAIVHEEVFVPRTAGEKKIVVTFGSQQLNEINGSTTLTVK